MKILLFILIAYIALSLKSFAQGDKFKVEENKIVYQKVYETELTHDELVEEVKKSGRFKEIEIYSDYLIGKVENVEADYVGAGYSRMQTPITILQHNFGGSFTIELKNGKYRVTFNNIVMTANYTDPFVKMGEVSSLEFYFLNKKGEIKPVFYKGSSKILDHTFNKLFSFQKKVEEEW